MLIRYSSAVADIVFLFDFPPLRRITFRIVPILSAADLIFFFFFSFPWQLVVILTLLISLLSGAVLLLIMTVF